MLGITPISEQAYTKQGNVYTKTNHGKLAAAAAITAGAAAVGVEYGIRKAKQIKMPNLKAIPAKVADYVKSIKLENIKKPFVKACDKVLSYIEKNPVKTKQAALFAASAAAIIAVGVTLDAIVNKVRAKKADKASNI